MSSRRASKTPYDEKKHLTLEQVTELMPLSLDPTRKLLRSQKVPYDVGRNGKQFFHKDEVLKLISEMEERRKIRAEWLCNGSGAYF